MNDTIGLIIIERAWDAADGRHVCQIRWTAAQLQRMGQAVREGDQAFLATVEQAIRRALEAAMTPQRG